MKNLFLFSLLLLLVLLLLEMLDGGKENDEEEERKTWQHRGWVSKIYFYESFNDVFAANKATKQASKEKKRDEIWKMDKSFNCAMMMTPKTKENMTWGATS